jgi:hypothetical protein
MTTTSIFEIYKEKLIHAQGFRLNQKQEFSTMMVLISVV